MRRILRRLEDLLLLSLLLLVANCRNCEYYEKIFVWRGEVWTLRYLKGDASSFHFVDPRGEEIEPEFLPFEIRSNDVGVQLPVGAHLRRARAASAEPPRYVFILDDYGEAAIRVFNQATAGLDASILLARNPLRMALSNDGETIYVTHHPLDAVEPGGPAPASLSIIDTSSKAVVGRVNLPADSFPWGVVFSPDGRFVYVAERGLFPEYANAAVLVFDAARGQLIDTIPLPSTPGELEITPDGALLYAAADPGLFAIDTTTREIAARIRSGLRRNEHILIDYTGSRLYGMGAGFVSVVDTATATEIKRIPIPQGEFAHTLNRLALSFDGGSLFVNDRNSTFLTRIDTAALEVAETIPVSEKRTDYSTVFMVP